MDNKYYWYSAFIRTETFWSYKKQIINRVCDMHPFIVCSFQYEGNFALLNWREITEEDYTLFKKMENE